MPAARAPFDFGAPLPKAPSVLSQGVEDTSHRLNRQANRAIHTIIIAQLTHGGEAADYINRRITEGKTKREAIRTAKRHLTRRIWKTLHNHNLT